MLMLMLMLAPGSCGARVSGSKEFLMEVYKENVSGSLLLAELLTLASFPPLGIGLAAREAELAPSWASRVGCQPPSVSSFLGFHRGQALDPALPRRLDKRAARSVGFLTGNLFLTGSKRLDDEMSNCCRSLQDTERFPEISRIRLSFPHVDACLKMAPQLASTILPASMSLCSRVEPPAMSQGCSHNRS